MIDKSAIEKFKTDLQGYLLLAGETGYDEARAIWNAMIDRRPSIIARCLGVADVIAGVNFAREHGLTLSIKGGGHNISGLAVCDEGLMLDMSMMRGVFVNPDTQTAHCQAGCTLGDVDREIQIHGLAAVLGFVSNTGIAGLTLDGALNRLPEDHSPVGNRDAAWVLNIAASWEKADDDDSNIGWARTAWQDMRRFSTGGTYVNFLTEEEGDERIHAAYGKNYERLVEVKNKWDPENLFRVNKNIVPTV